MGYNISDIYERANLRKIVGLLINGVEDSYELSGTCEEELKKADEEINEIICKHFKDEKLITEITNDVFRFADVYEKIYMEIGLKCGLMLAKDLTILNE